MGNEDKVLTYEEAKQLCREAFDAGAVYGSESMRYGVDAVAYNWDHWLKSNEDMFRPQPTLEDLLCELLNEYHEGECTLEESRLAEYATRMRKALAGDAE